MSDQPKRILDDASAPESLREALQLSAECPASDYDSAKGLSRLQAAIIAGPVVSNPSAPDPSAPDPSAPAQLAQTAGQSATWWGLAAVGTAAVLLALGAMAVLGGDSAEPSRVDRQAEPTNETTPNRPESPHLALPPDPPATPVAPSEPLPEDESQVPRPGVVNAPTSTTTRRPPTTPSATPSNSSGDEALRREIAQLAESRRLLSDNPAGALTLVRAGQREFRAGMFGEERAALEIFALVSLGRIPEAQRRGRRFVSRYGRGPFTERVRQVLDQDFSDGD